MAKSAVWETLKNLNFEKILIFEGFDGSRMPKMYSEEVLNIINKFLNFSNFFITLSAFTAKVLNFQAKNESKMIKSDMWENLKNLNLRELDF